MKDEQERDALDEWIANRLAAARPSTERRNRLIGAIQARTVPGAQRRAAVASVQARLRRPAAAWIVVGLLASAACLAWAAVLIFPGQWESIGAAELAVRAQTQWQPLGAWRSVRLEDQELAQSLSPYLRQTPRRWQAVSTDLDDRAILFDLSSSGGATAQLYALHANGRVSGLPTRPPQQPQTGRNGQWVAAWQEGDRVYVLTVTGSTANYWDRVSLGGAAVARTPGAPPSS